MEKNNFDEKGDKKKSKKENVKQVLKFLFFSLSAGIIQLGSDTLMVEVIKFPSWLSYLIALLLSIIWNFTFNRKFTFHSANNVPIAMLKVLLYYAIFTPLSTLWTYGLVDKLHWNSYLVLAITMVINCSTEFLYQKFFVFREKK